jgi:hypothetical protein
LPAGNVREFAVGDPGRTGCFASATGQAAIQVLGHPLGTFRALKEFLDEIDTASWTIQLIA